jgi:hypothetical protein
MRPDMEDATIIIDIGRVLVNHIEPAAVPKSRQYESMLPQIKICTAD